VTASAPQALLLAPSGDHGGGIERYVQTIEWALTAEGIEYHRCDLRGAGPAAHARLLAVARAWVRANRQPVRLIVAHRALLLVAWLLVRGRPDCEVSLICHGIEVWGTGSRLRRMIECRLMCRPRVRVVAVSNFTAGVLADKCQAGVLPPGLSGHWYDTLVRATSTATRTDPEVQLVTAFRLADWRDKGLAQLLEAVAVLGRPDLRVRVCGSGYPPAQLQQLVDRHPCCTLACDLSDNELAHELAVADLCVLATRTRCGRDAYGEGFGLVLLEAQVAGTAVVAPAHGGSREAFVTGLTGVSPVDESASSLAAILADLLREPELVAQMGKRAADWARETYAPERYARRAVAALF
jgi:glycosyltransferase involved in cell wall biosynthesis